MDAYLHLQQVQAQGSPVRTKEATNDPCGSLCNLALATGKDKRVDYML